MKKTSKFLSIILAILMVISIIPITASAATYSGTCGDDLTWTYDSSTYTLTISGTGAMYDYKSNNRPWESYEDKIKDVVIEEGVTSIGNYAFYHCDNLVSAELPDGIISIGESAFKWCEKLEYVNIPNGITTINAQTYAFCGNLKEITIPNGVTEIGDSAFHACYGLTEIVIPNSVKIIDESAFESCDSLTEVSIGKGVKSINRRAFSYCDNLTNIAIPKNVTTIEETAFACCENLSSITVDSESEYFVNDEYGVLFNKDKTMLIQYPAGSTEINYTIPDSVTTLCAESFDFCQNLENVIIPVSVTVIGDNAFSSYTQTIQIYYNGTSNQWNEMLGNNADTADFLADNYVVHCTDKTLYPSGICGDNLSWTYDTHSNTLTISGTGAMYNYEYGFGGFGTYPWVVFAYDVEHVIIKDGATSIGVCAFVDCQNLIDIQLSDSITLIDEDAFAYCYNLKDVYFTGTEEQWKSISIDDYNDRLINATIHYNSTAPHTHDYESVVTAPTCTEQGYTTYTCDCGDSYVDNYVDATGHHHKPEVTIPATHLEEGLMTFICACGDTYTGIIEKLEKHNYESVVTAPTCTEQGYTTYTCECGDSYVDDYVDALGHTEETIPSVAPSCTETGLTEGVKCSICGETHTEQKELPANGHTPENAVEENYVAPTCTENGSKDVVVYCSVCEDEISCETVVINATGHADNDGDGYCDTDNELLDPSVECECNCHKDGITNFFFKLILFFQRLFGSNKECSCGVIHY